MQNLLETIQNQYPEKTLGEIINGAKWDFLHSFDSKGLATAPTDVWNYEGAIVKIEVGDTPETCLYLFGFTESHRHTDDPAWIYEFEGKLCLDKDGASLHAYIPRVEGISFGVLFGQVEFDRTVAGRLVDFRAYEKMVEILSIRRQYKDELMEKDVPSKRYPVDYEYDVCSIHIANHPILKYGITYLTPPAELSDPNAEFYNCTFKCDAGTVRAKVEYCCFEGSGRYETDMLTNEIEAPTRASDFMAGVRLPDGYNFYFVREGKALAALARAGMTIVLTEDCGEDFQFGDRDIVYFASKKAKEVQDFFSEPFLARNPKLFAAWPGTHCGMLSYTFGWANTANIEQLHEAVMPQAFMQ